MRKWRVGTLSMGILLIFIGILLLVGQINGMSSAWLIIKWWPLILIVLGAEVLAHVYFSKEEFPKVKYDGFSIFIIIFILIASTLIYGASAVIENVPGVKDLSVFGIYRNETKYNKTMTVKLEDQKSFSIKNPNGNVVIKQAKGTDIEVESDISIINNDEAYAQTIADGIVEVSKNNGINVSTKSYNSVGGLRKIESVTVNYVISVPKGIDVNVDDEQGAVKISSLNNNVNIENNNGSITIENTIGNLVIGSSCSKITVSDIKGKLEIRNNGSIFAKNIDGDLNIVNENGIMDIKNTNKAINLSNTNGDINFENSKEINNNVDIENKYGAIRLIIPKSQKAHYKAVSMNGDIISNIHKNIESNNTAKTIDEIIGSGDVLINLKTNDGEINITGN